MKELLEALKTLTATLIMVDKEVQKSKRALTPAETKFIVEAKKQLRILRKEFIKSSGLPAPQLAKLVGLTESRIYQIRAE